MDSVVWKAHPAKERPRDLALLACVFFTTLAATLIAFNSLFLSTLAAIIILVGVSGFLFPTHYTLSDWGVEARGLVRSRARSWDDLRRFEVGPGAALVSPLASRSWLDRHRGIILMLDGADRDRVISMLNEQLGQREAADGAV